MHHPVQLQARRLSLPIIAILTVLTFVMATSTATQTFAAQQPSDSLPVTVKLHSGRKFTAVVDPRSSSEKLWLRFEGVAAKVLRPIRWETIAEASVEGDPVSIDEFRSHISEFAAGEYNIWEHGPSAPEPAISYPAGVPGVAASGPGLAEIVRGPAPRVASISTDVSLGYWDADAEADGLLIGLYPLSSQGWMIPAEGTLEVTLYAPRGQRRNSAHAIREIGHWSVPVHAADFMAGAPRYKLPFQALHPEFDLNVDNLGLVHARFVCPGSGVFEASNTSVRIREYSPFRDYLQRNKQYRFLPDERVSRPSY